MPTRKEQCGYCYYLDLYETNGVKSYCNKHRCYCKLYETCGAWKDGKRSEMQLREHCTWHVSTMIGEILNMNLNEKPFSNIKKLIGIIEQDEEKNVMIILYNIYGVLVAADLYLDRNKEAIAESLMPVLNKVSDLVDSNNIEEAYNLYAEIVVRLYKKYNYYLNSELSLTNEDNTKKLLIRK